jgi:hypothetical protein
MATAEDKTWLTIDNQDEIAAEIQAYGEVRRLLQTYALFLQNVVRHDNDETLLRTLNEKAKVIKNMPQSNELMHGFYSETTDPQHVDLLHMVPRRPWE